MDANEYQEKAKGTAIYPRHAQPYGSVAGLLYTALGLVNEAGEFAGKLKKIIRDNDGIISTDAYLQLIDELGDAGWYLAMCAKELGVDLNAVFQRNLDKLNSRKERDVLGGSGDNR